MARASTRKTLAEQIRANTLASRFYARMSIKPVTLPEVPDLPAQRAKAVPSGMEREASVLKAIIAALRKHPKVASVERNQSGVFRDGDRWIRVGSKGKLDLTCYLTSGLYIEIEVKSAKGVVSPEQQKRIETIRAKGGMAGVARSVAEAEALVNAA